MIVVTVYQNGVEQMLSKANALSNIGTQMNEILAAAATAAQQGMVSQIDATDKGTVSLNNRWMGIPMPVPGGRLKDVKITQEGNRTIVGTAAPYARIQDLGSDKPGWVIPGDGRRGAILRRQIGPNEWIHFKSPVKHPGLQPRGFRQAGLDAGIAAIKQKLQEIIATATSK